ncbi:MULTISPECIES: pentapeptide repeat-containing protein [unclassified Clostridium]|uniref:pentapeptide repeat-containing protein n=1 Tax=unclassified Clostridium TaxID=2614128 RepID=UPI0020799672|nr:MULTISPECIES: pentapeptide repeat-containing protein [unclassified Clostridium]
MLKYGQEQFDTALKNGIRKFDNIIFNKLKFVNEELKGIRFINCSLNGVEMLNCNLKDIYIENCEIKKCNFNESELDYIEIYKTSIEETDFSKCLVNSKEQYDWSGVSFKYCIFKLFEICSGLEIGNCIFDGCDFTDATIVCQEFFLCKIINSIMKNIKINSGIGSCDFTNTNLENSSLEELSGSNSFIGTNLKDAVLIGSEDIILDLFKGADLEGCVLCSLNSKNTVNLAMGNLSKADLEAVEWINANLNKCNLEDANIIEADLSGASLEEANLKNANLEDANLEGANLKNANLEGANLKGTNFNEAILDGVRILEHDYKYLKDYIDKNKVILK